MSQQELLDKVWPNLTVAESALRVNINKLRQVLGEADLGAGYVQNVAGRGYCFVEPISRLPTSRSWTLNEVLWTPKQNLPPAPMRMVGRDSIAEGIADRVLAHRFVTIVGPGGVGKTTLSIAVCYAIADRFDGKVVFADLGAISDQLLALTTIRTALHLPSNVESLSGLVAALKGHRLLLVLDCCEHVADEAAAIAERIFQNTDDCHLLLTSREPMHCDGEQVFNVPPLQFPAATETLTAREALAYPAVRLFVDSISAKDQGFQLQNTEAPVAAKICQRVDGIALALELAAGRVSAFGLDEVLRQLDGRMKLLWHGRRTAPPRQQTLEATLDWSFKLLGDIERMLLCRLSIFVGVFTLKDAEAVAANERLSELLISQHLGSLVDRCLVTVDLAGPSPHYRLLDMTREFALGKIATETERTSLARRHAAHFLQLLAEDAGIPPGRMAVHQNLPAAFRLGNIHAALEWCFSADKSGDMRLGLRLVAASGNFLLSQGLTLECRRWVEKALAELDATELGTQLELQLQIILASTFALAEYHKRVPIFDRAIALARDLGERRIYRTLTYERRYDQAFWGESEIALRAAFAARAELSDDDDGVELMIAEATIASISHTFGLDLEANRHFRSAFAHLKRSGHQAADLMSEKSFRRMRSTYANNLYTCGFVDQAAAIGEDFIERFETSRDFLAYGEIMTRISFIFEWRQEWHKVAQIYNAFVKNSLRQPTDDMHYLYSVMRCKLLMSIGAFKESVATLQGHFDQVPAGSPGRFILFVPLCEGLVRMDRQAEALQIIAQALVYEATYPRTGFRAEYLLCKANILISMPDPDAAEIERILHVSLDAAREQTSLTREMDTALALAGFLQRQNRVAESRAVLRPVHDRFTEGFETKVLIAAGEILGNTATA